MEETVDMPVVMQPQVRTTQRSGETIEVPKVRFIDDAVGISVAMRRRVPVNNHTGEVISGSMRQLRGKQLARQAGNAREKKRKWERGRKERK